VVDFSPVRYLKLLRGLHEQLAPPTYCEIGIRGGHSLELSRARTIGIDPEFAIKRELRCPIALFRTTSDEYFSRPHPREPVGGDRFALSFIDGMHLFEFALRDFVNVERHSEWWSVIVFDDMLPREVVEANRERATRAWTGDVFKVMTVLERHRPDLICLRVGTEPTGLLLVLGADPSSTVLSDSYDQLVQELVVPDPQPVPADILERRGALDPAEVLAHPVWAMLREARDLGLSRDEGWEPIRMAVRQSFPEPDAVRGGRLRALLRGRR
jgi:hypothetical protein